MLDEVGRCTAAMALLPSERRAIVEGFFSVHPGAGEGRFGLGQAILDFQIWEVESERITEGGGSAWWRTVNGLMVLDIADAHQDSASDMTSVRAWQTYALGQGTQSDLWEAHQRSLHTAVRCCGALLERETAAERAFAGVVIDIVDRTALAARRTDSAELAELTRRYYPWSYPAVPAALSGLELLQERTADRLRGGDDGMVIANVGIESSRWQ